MSAKRPKARWLSHSVLSTNSWQLNNVCKNPVTNKDHNVKPGFDAISEFGVMSHQSSEVVPRTLVVLHHVNSTQSKIQFSGQNRRGDHVWAVVDIEPSLPKSILMVICKFEERQTPDSKLSCF